MSLIKKQRRQFLKKGYFLGKIDVNIAKKLRKKYFSIFNSVSKLSNGKKIKNDLDLIELYNSTKRFVWAAAFDQAVKDIQEQDEKDRHSGQLRVLNTGGYY